MATIFTDQFDGAAGVAGPRTDGRATLAEALRDIADDLASVKGITELVATASTSNTAVADAANTQVADAANTLAADAVAPAQVDAVVTAVADVSATAAADAVVTAVGDVQADYGVVDGLVVDSPTTPSSQAADPGGFTDWNVNIAEGYGFANAVGHYESANVDEDVSTGAKILEIGEAVYAWLVFEETGGAVSLAKVLGTAAVSGNETIPDDAAITAAVGHARWYKLALCHAHRTGDATVVTTEDASYATRWGGGAAALVNDLKAKYNAAVATINETKADLAEAAALANDLKAKYNAAVALVNELKGIAGVLVTLANGVKSAHAGTVALANGIKGTAVAGIVSLVNAIKAAVNTSSDDVSPTLKTTKG